MVNGLNGFPVARMSQKLFWLMFLILNRNYHGAEANRNRAVTQMETNMENGPSGMIMNILNLTETMIRAS